MVQIACHAPRERVSWNSKSAEETTGKISHAPRERVSWNRQDTEGDVKCQVTLHVSVWVEIDCHNNYLFHFFCHAPRERVSWNLDTLKIYFYHWSHAPRERVSWNSFPCSILFRQKVTLHVSVWVEIQRPLKLCDSIYVTLHVSVWVEIITTGKTTFDKSSRSTWACELKCVAEFFKATLNGSRSTWACELKLKIIAVPAPVVCHAPRERVSWNFYLKQMYGIVCCHAPRERVSWNVQVYFISVIVWVSRSTWACELKYIYDKSTTSCSGHAPRERVSWNWLILIMIGFVVVTLHVSVWVEIEIRWYKLNKKTSHAPRERVSWNSNTSNNSNISNSHAPRERVSWNFQRRMCLQLEYRHAPRERVSWNECHWTACFDLDGHAPRERVSWNSMSDFPILQRSGVTLHVSVWVEMKNQQKQKATWTVTLHVSVWVEMKMVLLSRFVNTSRSTWACELKFQR